MPSLRQLAKLIGVSASTVSRAMRDDPQISEATRRRVKEFAELYRYHPTHFLQSVIAGKSNTIGFLLPSVHSNFFSYVLEGVLERAFSESIHVITLRAGDQFQNCLIALETFIELRVEGMLLSTGYSAALPRSAVLEIWSHGIPAVRIGDTRVEAPMDQVITDEDQAAELAIAHLYDLGHREIAFLGHPALSISKAVRCVMQRRGLTTAYHRSNEGDPSLRSIVDDWLALPVPPTAVFTLSDSLAVRLLQVVNNKGIRVPREFSIMGGFDVEWISPYLTPPLTTIQHQPSEIGRQAFDLLLRRMRSGEPPSTFQPEHICIPTTLIKRASCAPPQHKRTW
ncbi:MAG TPA: LacI family DNA-binding transcriptional regulator [Armatimonadota bacterium]